LATTKRFVENECELFTKPNCKQHKLVWLKVVGKFSLLVFVPFKCHWCNSYWQERM